MKKRMNFLRPSLFVLAAAAALTLAFGPTARADDAADAPTTQPADMQPAEVVDGIGHLPHIEIDVKKKQVRVECAALAVDAPLEFLCVLNGTSEHESVLRSAVRPRDLHVALLALGLKAGAPMNYDMKTNVWTPPHGPGLKIMLEYKKGDKTISAPAYTWIRDQHTNKVPDKFAWVFCGSRITPHGEYAADGTGYIVSLVNFDYTLIDVPQMVSSSDETLEWVRNKELTPPKGTKVWMVISPEPKSDVKPATKPVD